jgi:hypothetical protein
MDLRRIVEEVEERKREEYALLAPPKPRPKAAQGSGVTASILEHVRDRMLREDPGADVRAINEVIEPESSTPAPSAPTARLTAEPFAAALARQAARDAKKAPKAAQSSRRARDDFLARYLVMSEEFQKRYKVKGWTDLVRKKCSSELRP